MFNYSCCKEVFLVVKNKWVMASNRITSERLTIPLFDLSDLTLQISTPAALDLYDNAAELWYQMLWYSCKTLTIIIKHEPFISLQGLIGWIIHKCYLNFNKKSKKTDISKTSFVMWQHNCLNLLLRMRRL